MQDRANVTPKSPGQEADVEPYKQPVDENGNPATDPETGEEIPKEEQTDFCKQHPDALACWEGGEADNVDLDNGAVGTSVTPVAVGSSATCPANKSVTYLGANLTISFDPICTAAGWIRPVVMALAWLLAGYILVGAVRTE